MNITDLSIKRPIAIGSVFLAIIVFGFVALTKLKIDLFPNISLPMMVVFSSYPGAGPEEIETELTEPLEKTLGTVSHLEKITSSSSENAVMIMLQFNWGTDLDAAANDVRDNIGFIQSYLPEDATTPMIFKFDISMQPVVMYYIAGNIDPRELNTIAEDIADRLQRIGGVAASFAGGENQEEVQIIVDPLKLAGTGITTDQINSILQAQNLNYPLGSVEAGTKVYTLRLIGQYGDLDEIRKTVVGNGKGVPILLGQVAEIVSRPAKATSVSRVNGITSMFGMVQKRPDANTVAVSNAVVNELNAIKKTLPPGVNISIAFNQAKYITRSVRSTADTLWMGALLAVIILFLFFGNLRATFFVAVSIPITVFFTLFLMYLFGMTMNIVSLGGLTIAIGMVVDAAIVVFEAIYRHQEEKHESAIVASSVGTKEVAAAITGSTLTTVAVFLPLLLVSGLASIFFNQLALTVTFALMSSLVVALTILPMFTSRFLDVGKMQKSKVTGAFNDFYKKFEGFYVRVVTWALKHRKVVVFGTLIVFIVSLALYPFIGSELMPESDRGVISLAAEMPLGTNLATTDSAIMKLEKILLKEVPEANVLTTTTGTGSGFMALFNQTSGAHSASVDMYLVDKEKRKRTIKAIQHDLRDKMDVIPGLEVRVATQSMEAMFGGGKPVEIKLFGYDLERVVGYSELLMDSLKGIKGLTDIESDFIKGKPEYRFLIDRQKAASFGLTPYQVGSVLRTRFEGTVATIYRREGKEYDMKIKFDEKYVNNLERIKSMTMTTPMGDVPLRNFLVDTMSTGPVTIKHEDNERIVTVTANVEGRDLNRVARDVVKKMNSLPVPAGVNAKMGGSFQQMQSTFRDLGFVILLSLALVYLIMAGQFESFKEPFVIMFTIPLGIIGVMWALFFTGTTINMQSLLGVLILGGVVVNNAIVYIDYTNQLRFKAGMTLIEALIEAGRVRLRPILMTALTTIVGLFPMALGIGSGNELRAPMARSVMGGLVVATFLTLVFIPSLFTYFVREKKTAAK
jgi:HAE1 family hydrophobic/amphiphilic exporter-1